jgi:GNAT superfamily N-acetyltransferase
MKWQGQYYSAQMCRSEGDIDALFHFSNDVGGFGFYRSQIAASEIWPMAVLLDVEVPHQLRRQGLGTAAIAEFLGTARGKGARLAFLRVSWFGELSERDKMVSWYRRRGWQLLQIPPVPSLVVPFMYHEL